MSKRVSILVVVIICVCIGGFCFLLGAGYSGLYFKNYIMDANASWLSQHINRLAMIRIEWVEEAASDIENTLDNSIIQLSWAGLDRKGEFHGGRLPEAHLRALQMARVYADAGYRDAFSEESLGILEKVEPPDRKSCPAAIRELQERTRE
ncbi:MAG: hypothetical protein ACETWQ_02135 [Phycisphaerae bacterium]